MPRAAAVPISGEVLRWAIRESGLSPHAVAERLRVASDTLEEWQTGKSLPTKTDFSRLVEVLKRPSAIFFLPAPPQTAVKALSFRRAHTETETIATPEESRWIRVTSRLQEAASLVLERMGHDAVPLRVVTTSSDPEAVGESERRLSDVSVETQTSWRSVGEAFAAWRGYLESLGVMVFNLRLGRSGCKGFSLWDERAPLVALNTAYGKQARTYTLFHEYAHLLTRTNSVCTSINAFGVSAGDPTERWCEKFAAAYLLPRGSFVGHAQRLIRTGETIGFPLVSRIATHFKVSLRAVALRLVEVGLAGWDLYTEVDRIARIKEQEPRGGRGKGLKKHQRRVEEFGRWLPEVLLRGVGRDVLDTHDVLDYLDISTGDLSQLKKALAGQRA
jgi:Zn-dependent peptidase ImmA (M78 family)/transcriptional regulator with XRE-family HTH domain